MQQDRVVCTAHSSEFNFHLSYILLLVRFVFFFSLSLSLPPSFSFFLDSIRRFDNAQKCITSSIRLFVLTERVKEVYDLRAEDSAFHSRKGQTRGLSQLITQSKDNRFLSQIVNKSRRCKKLHAIRQMKLRNIVVVSLIKRGEVVQCLPPL